MWKEQCKCVDEYKQSGTDVQIDIDRYADI